MQRVITQNIVSLAVLQIISKAIMFGFIIMVTRSLGDELFGKYGYLLNVLIILDVVIDYGMTPYTVKSIAEDKRRSAAFFMYPLLLKYSITIICSIGIVLYGSFLENDPVKQHALPYLIIILFTWPLFNSTISIFQAHERQDFYGLFYIMRNGLLIIITYILLIRGLEVDAPIIGYALSSIITAFAGMLWIRKRFFTFSVASFNSKNFVFDLLRKGLPFYASTLITALFLRIDVVLLSWIRGDIETGLFKAAQQILDGLLLISLVVGNTIFPVLSRIASNDKNRFHSIYGKSVKLLLFFILPIAVFITLTAEDIIRIMYGPEEYKGSVLPLQVLVWYLVPNFLNYINLHSLYAYNRQKNVMLVIAAGLSFKVLLTILLVPVLGYMGSCYTGIAAEAVLLAGYSYYGKKTYAGYFPWIDAARIVAASLLMFAALWLLQPYLSFWLLIPSAGLIYGAGALIMRAVNKEEMVNVYNSIIKTKQGS